MRKLTLISTASAVGLLAMVGSAAADSTFSGVGQLYVGAGTTDGSFFAGKELDDPFIFGGKAKGYWPLSPDVQLQVDLFAEQDSDVMKDWSDDDNATTLGAAVHLLHPFENRARLGVAGSIWSTDVYLPAGDSVTDSTYGLLAFEGQFFGTDWTATGQAGIFTTMSCDEEGNSCPFVVEDGTFIRGKIRYFLNDNTSLSVEASQMWGSTDDIGDIDPIFDGKSVSMHSSLWTLEGEHKFSDSPFAGAISLSHENTEVTSFTEVTSDTNTVTFSLKYYYNQPTLRSNDKSGAELDTPQFGHALETAGPMGLFGSIFGLIIP